MKRYWGFVHSNIQMGLLWGCTHTSSWRGLLNCGPFHTFSTHINTNGGQLVTRRGNWRVSLKKNGVQTPTRKNARRYTIYLLANSTQMNSSRAIAGDEKHGCAAAVRLELAWKKVTINVSLLHLQIFPLSPLTNRNYKCVSKCSVKTSSVPSAAFRFHAWKMKKHWDWAQLVPSLSINSITAVIEGCWTLSDQSKR